MTKVTATKGKGAPCSIGKGEGPKAICGTVTIGCTLGTDGKPVEGSGKVYNDGISQGKYIYPENLLPLTMEALTDGKIMVVVDEDDDKNKVNSWGMQYAVNDGDKKTIKTTTQFSVKKGYRVTFYGNDTFTDCYYGTKISGGEAEVIDLETIGMLCSSVSSELGGDADSPGKAREWDDWSDMDEEL